MTKRRSANFRFYSLYDKMYRRDVLEAAWTPCRANGAVPGVDGQSFDDIEKYGVGQWLDELTEELFRNLHPGVFHREHSRKSPGPSVAMPKVRGQGRGTANIGSSGLRCKAAGRLPRSPAFRRNAA